MKSKYKILSLDGGGSWALIQLLTLQEKYPGKTGHEILREFDLVIANSGGSITLATLVANWSLEKAIDLFNKREEREKIFSRTPYWKKYFPTGLSRLMSFGPKYSTKAKFEGFRQVFKEIQKYTLDELPAFIGKKSLRIVICTFDAINNKSKFFKSYYKDIKKYDKINLIKAIHGSTNAPVNYFDFPANFKAQGTNRFYYLWDGALGGFNNPVAAGLIEAIEAGVDKSTIQIISLGTANKTMSVSEKNFFYKLYINVRKHRKTKPGMGMKFFMRTTMNLAKSILYEPPDWSNYVAYVLRFDYNLDNPENIKSFIRLSPMIHVYKKAKPDTVKLIDKLYTLDMDLTSDEDIEYVKKCFESWKSGQIKNQPIKGTILRDDELIYSIGHKTFKEAMADWE